MVLLRRMKKKNLSPLLVLLFVLVSSSMATAFIVKRDWQNLNERHQVQTELNTQLASDYLKKSWKRAST